MAPDRLRPPIIALALVLLIVAGCAGPVEAPVTVGPTRPATGPTVAPTPPPPVDQGDLAGLSENEIAALESLEQVDDYPLYTMHYRGPYRRAAAAGPFRSPEVVPAPAVLPWACSLFAALGTPGHMHYGRNFDWEYSPAVLLFTDPADGYDAVSMVDIAYFFTPGEAGDLTDLPLSERRALLNAPFWPFDGMNERGLAVGMAAVPYSEMPYQADQEGIGSLEIIREILDHAATVDEAIAIMQGYNLNWEGGPPLHYLIADASGRAALVEFYGGDMVLIPNQGSWHAATNFLRTAAGGTGQGACWRYDYVYQRLDETGGRLTAGEAMELLAGVSQDITQWSIVYGISDGAVQVAMGKQYGQVHRFRVGHGEE